MNNAIVPIAGTAVVYAIAQGWMEQLWQKLYIAAHAGGGPSAPISQQSGPLGQGGGLLGSGVPGPFGLPPGPNPGQALSGVVASEIQRLEAAGASKTTIENALMQQFGITRSQADTMISNANS